MTKIALCGLEAPGRFDSLGMTLALFSMVELRERRCAVVSVRSVPVFP